MSSDFAVDLQALIDAASGVSSTIDLVEQQRVEDIDCPKSAFGHERLATASSDFCDRWQHGVDCLVKDGREVADRLAASVNDYTNTDQTLADTFLDTLAELAERTGGNTYAE